MTAKLTIPAAQYLRMSTDHQQYSMQNQADAIGRYASDQGYCVVKTYSDPAKSGLRLRNRAGLKQLLKEVVEGKVSFQAILVYDVSRWGRFQDADEAAHYEYLCKSSGIPVYYCAEQFTNDNSPAGLILKALKRTMAGEYSRELSVKVRAGLLRLAKLGFKTGGYAPFGLRRQLLDANGTPKQLLAYRERKSISHDRVILVPGPAEEVAIVQRIFREFADEGKGLTAIARSLNAENVAFTTGHAWTVCTITNLLKNPKYIGTQVWGRTTEYLSGPVRKLPEEQWVVCGHALDPIVSPELFKRAQARFENFTHNLSNGQLLERLKPLLLRHNGKLSGKIIDASRSCPSLTTYCTRFGGLLNVYRQLGCLTPEVLTQASNRLRGILIRSALIKDLTDVFPTQLEVARKGGRFRSLLRYRRSGLLVAVVLARHDPDANVNCWRIDVPKAERKRAAVVAFLNRTNDAVEALQVFDRLRYSRLTIRPGQNDERWKSARPLTRISDLLAVLRHLRADTRADGNREASVS
ncbi:MAG TPA: recombinase family protein [Candidatus Binatia bacterium]|nr:recombinase family protein [Candidatus Binatia bacterium]